MESLELVQKIGNTVCEECGPNRDCELDPKDCDRIIEALELLDDYVENQVFWWTQK